MRHQQHGRRVQLRLLGDRLVVFFHRGIQLVQHRQQLLPAMARPRSQLEPFKFDAALLREQLLLPADPFAHSQRVQLVADRIPHPYQLLPMPHQLPQIALLQTGPPDPRKAIAQQQVQHVRRVACIRLLFAHHRRPNLRRISDPQLVSQFSQHALEPARVSGGFEPHPHGRGQPRIERPRFATFVFQATLHQLARLRIQHGHLLVARMQITPYNLHVLGSFPPSLGFVERYQVYSAVWEPTPLSNQANGNLVDRTTGTGAYTADVTGSGVQLSNDGGATSATGMFLNKDVKPTGNQLQSYDTVVQAGNLPGFLFTFTNSKMEANQTAAGFFSFGGTTLEADRALEAAGFKYTMLGGVHFGSNE